ncbi:MAG TPA: S26 family signal peptidase [Blastocatellia bacterium]|jgi:signal peptidase I
MDSSRLEARAVARAADALISDRLRAGKTLCFTISTSSMWPALSPGDRVIVRVAHIDELRAGDIVIRKAADSYIAHRLLGRKDTRLLTKGDNALTADPYWEAGELVGVIAAIERAGQKKRASFVRAGWGAHLMAVLSRGQLLAGAARPEMLRRPVIKILRACLRAAARWGT